MTKALQILAAVVVSFGIITALSAAMNETNPEESLRAARVGTPVPGPAIKLVASSTSSAASPALDRHTVYLLSCDVAVHVETGVASPVADFRDFVLPPSMFPWRTDNEVRYIAVRAKSAAGTCWLWKTR